MKEDKIEDSIEGKLVAYDMPNGVTFIGIIPEGKYPGFNLAQGLGDLTNYFVRITTDLIKKYELDSSKKDAPVMAYNEYLAQEYINDLVVETKTSKRKPILQNLNSIANNKLPTLPVWSYYLGEIKHNPKKTSVWFNGSYREKWTPEKQKHWMDALERNTNSLVNLWKFIGKSSQKKSEQ